MTREGPRHDQAQRKHVDPRPVETKESPGSEAGVRAQIDGAGEELTGTGADLAGSGAAALPGTGLVPETTPKK